MQRKADADINRTAGASRRTTLQTVALVAGGRYELYRNYALQIQAVAASIATTVSSTALPSLPP